MQYDKILKSRPFLSDDPGSNFEDPEICVFDVTAIRITSMIVLNDKGELEKFKLNHPTMPHDVTDELCERLSQVSATIRSPIR